MALMGYHRVGSAPSALTRSLQPAEHGCHREAGLRRGHVQGGLGALGPACFAPGLPAAVAGGSRATPVRLTARAAPVPKLLTPAGTHTGAVEATRGLPACRLPLGWQRSLLPGARRPEDQGGWWSPVHLWTGAGPECRCCVDCRSHANAPCAPSGMRPYVVVPSTPRRSPPGAGHVSGDALFPTAHRASWVWRVARADAAGGAHLAAGEYDRRAEGSRKGVVKVA
jgi:hypothetical protein